MGPGGARVHRPKRSGGGASIYMAMGKSPSPLGHFLVKLFGVERAPTPLEIALTCAPLGSSLNSLFPQGELGWNHVSVCHWDHRRKIGCCLCLPLGRNFGNTPSSVEIVLVWEGERRAGTCWRTRKASGVSKVPKASRLKIQG